MTTGTCLGGGDAIDGGTLVAQQTPGDTIADDLPHFAGRATAPGRRA
jgi:hypothetical protein